MELQGRGSRRLKNPKREQAAQLLSLDNISDEKIALEVGISPRQFANWKKRADFLARVGYLEERITERVMRHRLARREIRIAEAQADYDRTSEIILGRRADPTMANVPGAASGALVRTVKGIRVTTKDGRGREVTKYQLIPEYRYEEALIENRQAIRQEVARELGQLPNELSIGGQQITVNQNSYIMAIWKACGRDPIAPHEGTAEAGARIVDAAGFEPDNGTGNLPAGIEAD